MTQALMSAARGISRAGARLRARWRGTPEDGRFDAIYRRFQEFTMIPSWAYRANLRIVQLASGVPGCVVECGVWRGGMSAGIAAVLGPEREYFLFDSFEGLPPAQAIDGAAALAWQADTASPGYYDNCRAEMHFADEAMKRAGAARYHLVRGWFDQTLPAFTPPSPIAVLRLDADWYESTIACLQHLYPHVSAEGVIVIDDYYTWDGCSRAVHDFLSRQQSTARLHEFEGVCYLRGARS